MLKKSSSFVLGSLRGSTYGPKYASPLRHWALTDSRPSAGVRLLIRRVADFPAALPVARRVLARRGWAGEINALFEHPAGIRTETKTDRS